VRGLIGAFGLNRLEMEVMPMFLDFYHLREQPFGVTPDPAYLYPSRTHCEALDSLTEGILGGRGFLALIAEPGMGKTTLLYQLLEGLRDTARAAFLFQTQCNSREFFQYLLSELEVDSTGMGLVAMHNKLNEMLFAEMLAGKRFVLIVDEAQNLDDSVLETIRLLSNFETSNTKLLQIVLAGQPQLEEKLGQRRLAQLLQRITVVKHLEALSPEETASYIRHRLKVAGHCGEALFEPEALALVAERSQGVPRSINKICFHALMEAHAEGRCAVSPDIVEKADRKSNVVAVARPTPMPMPTLMPVPSPAPSRTDSVETADVAVEAADVDSVPRLTYMPLAGSGLRRWSLWAGTAVLLSAGLILSCNTLMQMMQITRDQVVAALISPLGHRDRGSAIGGARARFAEFSKSLLEGEELGDGRQTPGVRESTGSSEAAEPRLSKRAMSNVTAIQVSSTESDARVVIMLDNAVQYDSARITSPDRIYFDLYKARLSPYVGQKTIPIVPTENGLLKWVRARQNADEVVRLVLDADGAKDYSAQLLLDPYRLVIDVHARAMAATKPGQGSDVARYNVSNVPPEASASHARRLSLTRELGLKITRIVVDPGHGGYDTGTMGPSGLLEKDLCLDVALRLGQLIEENTADAEVLYTRKDDRYVPLEQRAAIANAINADLFISIHANSSDRRETRGVETYYLSLATAQESMELALRENALALSSLHDLPDLVKKITSSEKIAESKQLAVDMQNALSQRLQLVSGHEPNRGVKQAPFIVLTGANMPAVLSEISFISNASDESLLLESGQRQRVAEGLYFGIAAYLDSLHSPPQNKQKLVSENGPGTPSEVATSTVAIGRDPLKNPQ
jgi:N-acetylmuramoyl-L-alanine amidase/type II secretory pathway predicted ATPase ExeA